MTHRKKKIQQLIMQRQRQWQDYIIKHKVHNYLLLFIYKTSKALRIEIIRFLFLWIPHTQTIRYEYRYFRWSAIVAVFTTNNITNSATSTESAAAISPERCYQSNSYYDNNESNDFSNSYYQSIISLIRMHLIYFNSYYSSDLFW